MSCSGPVKVKRAGSRGYSCFVCGPSRSEGGPGEVYYPSGRPMFDHVDTDHGNGYYKLRDGQGGPNWKDQRPPQYTASMGNSADAVYMCASTNGPPALELEFDEVTPVEWFGPTLVWVDAVDDMSCNPGWEQFTLNDAVELPGLGLYGLYDTVHHRRNPLCRLWNHYLGWPGERLCDEGEDTSILSCELEDLLPYCNGTTVYLRVGLDLNSEGVPQLRDYDLSLRKLTDSDPQVEIDPPVYPDSPRTWESGWCVEPDRIRTEGNVQCPYDTWMTTMECPA